MKGGFQTAIAPEAADTIFHRGSRTSSEADAPWFQELVEASLSPSTASFITRPPVLASFSLARLARSADDIVKAPKVVVLLEVSKAEDDNEIPEQVRAVTA
ncbi:hypothetical protein C0Q70_11072 [Pomacea canaliculata]|uniref:Uncharacterized protein n=1 Tax=Pomacea canaliculata TaxID=400727 RepID=A0A2T7P4X7_POMCA|nr:hypothetical protein C0Q70_11072 [Pomacea canaliculata]